MSKHHIELTDGEVRPVYFAVYKAGRTARQLAVAEIKRMLDQKGPENMTIKRVVFIVFAAKKNF